MHSPHFDSNYLIQEYSLDEDTIIEFKMAYSESCCDSQRQLLSLLHELGKDDIDVKVYEEGKKIMHTIKGTSLAVGDTALSEIAKTSEFHFRDLDRDKATNSLILVLDRINSAIKAISI